MKQAELQHYRAMLQAQAVEPTPRRGLFAAHAAPRMTPPTDSAFRLSAASIIRRPSAILFGRRRLDAAQPDEPLLLDAPLPGPASSAGPVRKPLTAAHFADTPFHPEDLADPPSALSLAPGVIAGWSAAKPASAETRLLRRLAAVLQAEQQGLAARLNGVQRATG